MEGDTADKIATHAQYCHGAKMADAKIEIMDEEHEQSPSPATPDSRKRPLDVDSDNAMSKKSHYIPGRYSLIGGE